MYHVAEPARRTSNIWLVYVGHNLIDTVFFDDDCNKEYVRDSLIDHDGYPANINVKKG